MRRLKSITESNDETDFFRQTANKLPNIKLPTVVEEEEEEYGEGGGEDTDGVGLYLNKHRSSPLGTSKATIFCKTCLYSTFYK